MTPEDLYSLLGTSRDLGVEGLRHAYEGAVEAATNRHDWARAKALSAAFDRLPTSVRLAMYPGRERDARRWGDVTDAVVARPVRRSSRTRVRWRVMLAWALVATLAAVAVIASIRKDAGSGQPQAGAPFALPSVAHFVPTSSVVPRSSADALHKSRTPSPTRPLTVVIRIWTDPSVGNTGHQIEGLPLWKTPAAIPLDQHGLATMRCSAVGAYPPGRWSKIDPRAVFTCPPGSGPEYLRP